MRICLVYKKGSLKHPRVVISGGQLQPKMDRVAGGKICQLLCPFVGLTELCFTPFFRVLQQDRAPVTKLENALQMHFLLAFFHSLSHSSLPVSVSWDQLSYKLLAVESCLRVSFWGNLIKVVKFLLCKIKTIIPVHMGIVKIK